MEPLTLSRPSRPANIASRVFLLVLLGLATLTSRMGYAQPPPPPCHPNPRANLDMAIVRERGDIRHLPGPLKDRLDRFSGQPHTQFPSQAYDQAHFYQATLQTQPNQHFQHSRVETH